MRIYGWTGSIANTGQMSKPDMTPERFRACLPLIGWTGQGLARLLGRNEREVRRWASGAQAVPPHIGPWLERLARFHENNPPPTPNEQQMVHAIEPAGFIVSSEAAIWGAAATAELAWAEMLRCMKEAGIHVVMDREPRTEQQDADDMAIWLRGGACTDASDYNISPASAALIAKVDAEGGAFAFFRSVGGVCCTLAEAQALGLE